MTEVPDRHFLVTHRFSGARYRATATSKTRLKKRLPRFSETDGYMVLFDIEEVDLKKYRRMKHLPDAPYAK